MKLQLNKIWFTSDHHFGHSNIIKYTNRPFSSVKEMDETLIENWNSQVKPGDTVYHLGDFTLSHKKDAIRYLSQLNGNINFLCNYWHHDRRWIPSVTGQLFDFRNHSILSPMVVLEFPELGKNGYPLAITLCHYPLAVWDRKHYGAWHLHGRSQYRGDGNILDVGVDNNNYYPFSLEDVYKIMRADRDRF